MRASAAWKLLPRTAEAVMTEKPCCIVGPGLRVTSPNANVLPAPNPMTALARGEWVLCDRFTDATFAYQGAGRGVDAGKLATLEQWVQGALQPDLTIVFDLPPAVGRARAGSIKVPDRFERESEAFFERVREGYLQRARSAPQRVRVVDASRGIDAIQAELQTIAESLCR